MATQVPDHSARSHAALQEQFTAAEAEVVRLRRDLAEALEQQTATAEVLRVIASSPNALEHVVNAIASAAARFTDSDGAAVQQAVGSRFLSIGRYGTTRDLLDAAESVGQFQGTPISPDTMSGRTFIERRTIHVPDVPAVVEAEYPGSLHDHRLTQQRSQVTTPLLREGEAIGVLGVFRSEQRPFTDQQIALLETFADQAVIAIENARLFEDLRSRTDELAELNQTLEARVREQVDQLERVGRLRRYLSPQLAELIVSSGDESILASHRRLVTVVFCDLRGFTAFAESAEPEEVMGVLGEYHTAMGELIRRYEGTFGHFAGDGLMIFFNDPMPQPDHAERAVRMACAMRERAAGLARGWRRAGYELDFGVGVAVGYATLGRIGFEGRYDYDVIGTVANLAARLCAEAAGGQILIPARLHGMIEGLIEVEPAGELTLKGLHRPVVAFNITGLREAELLVLDQATGQATRDA